MHVVALARPSLVFVVLVGAVALLLLQPPTPAAGGATLVVNTQGSGGDISPGDGLCINDLGTCSLQAAVQEANALPGADAIHFSITGGANDEADVFAGVTVTSPVTIDATTQPGYAGVPLIRTQGIAAKQFYFTAGSGGSVLRGMAINNASDVAVDIDTSNITLEANYIGTEDGLNPNLPVNGQGVRMAPIFGDFILSGRIGSTVPGMGNRIMFSSGRGLNLVGPASNIQINGNRIAFNGAEEIYMFGASNQVGAVGAGNAITSSDTSTASIRVVSEFSANNVFRANSLDYVGPSGGGATGIDDAGTGTIVGGTSTGEGNTFSGLFFGAILRGNGTLVYGNLFTGGAYSITVGGNNNRIGGVQPGQPNRIEHYLGFGVGVPPPTGGATPVSGNAIRGNDFDDFGADALEIDLGQVGHNGNDSLDGDSGPNGMQNYPATTSAVVAGDSLIGVSGTLNSTPNTAFVIDYYIGTINCATTEKKWIGEIQTATDGSGNASFYGEFSYPGGFWVHGTATDSGGNTSEFHPSCAAVNCGGGDCDGFADIAPTAHRGPANTDHAFDNCIGLFNIHQGNADGNFIELKPHRTYDDLTRPMSDALGDGCDPDSDNDWYVDEGAGGACGSASRLNPDSDNDRVLDGAECAIGTNPTSAVSAPSLAFCAAHLGVTTNYDGDGDGLFAAREYCNYGTSDANVNSDGDACSDAKEVGSINTDNTISAIDLNQVAQLFGNYSVTTPLPDVRVRINFDINKDGTISALDLLFMAQKFGPC